MYNQNQVFFRNFINKKPPRTLFELLEVLFNLSSAYRAPTNLPFFPLAGNLAFTIFLDCMSLKTFSASST